MAITDPCDEIEAFVTDAARQYLARAINGELVYQVKTFSVGRGGFNPADPVKVIPVNTADTALIDPVYPDTTNTTPIEGVEEPTNSVRAFYCRLPATPLPTNADYGLGELGIWAEILTSNVPMEIGTSFLYAIAHFPIKAKTRRDVQLFRAVVNF